VNEVDPLPRLILDCEVPAIHPDVGIADGEGKGRLVREMGQDDPAAEVQLEAIIALLKRQCHAILLPGRAFVTAPYLL
jgi:hypothetical protein